MLTVKILCVGKLKERYWRDACAEYEKRLNGFCRFSIQEISESRLPENPSHAQIDSALAEEGEKLLSASTGSLKVALCCPAWFELDILLHWQFLWSQR